VSPFGRENGRSAYSFVRGTAACRRKSHHPDAERLFHANEACHPYAVVFVWHVMDTLGVMHVCGQFFRGVSIDAAGLVPPDRCDELRDPDLDAVAVHCSRRSIGDRVATASCGCTALCRNRMWQACRHVTRPAGRSPTAPPSSACGPVRRRARPRGPAPRPRAALQAGHRRAEHRAAAPCCQRTLWSRSRRWAWPARRPIGACAVGACARSATAAAPGGTARPGHAWPSCRAAASGRFTRSRRIPGRCA